MATATRPRRTPQQRSGGHKYVITIGAVLVVLVAGLAGWLLGDALRSNAHHDVKVLDTFTGDVTMVNANGLTGCVQPPGGSKVCSAFATFGNTVHVGETVHVAHEVYRDRHGDGYSLLLIVPASPPG